MNRYAKSIMAVVATVLVAVLPFLANHNHLTDAEWITVTIAGLSAVTVFIVPNVPGSWSNYTKSIVAVLMAVAAALSTMIGAGGFAALTPGELIQIILIALAAVGVYGVPNGTTAVPPATSPPAVQ